jgi:hypothetical protein
MMCTISRGLVVNFVQKIPSFFLVQFDLLPLTKACFDGFWGDMG